MTIPVRVLAGAWSGRRVGGDLDAGVDVALTRVAEQALRGGTRAGLEALTREALRLTGATGAALYEGRTCVARAGISPGPRSAPASRKGARKAILVVWPEPPGAAERAVLGRLGTFATALLAAHARESATEARQARLLATQRRLERTVATQERRRSRASHDLRTPLMVMKGYVDMMLKGTAGPLTPAMQRYLERLQKVAGDQAVLIERLLSRPVESVDDLRPLLREAFGPSRRRRKVETVLSLPVDRPVAIRGPESLVTPLLRELARGVLGTGAVAVDVHVDAPEGAGTWRLRVSARAGRALSERSASMLRQLTLRLEGTLSIHMKPRLELTLLLPAEDVFPAAGRGWA